MKKYTFICYIKTESLIKLLLNSLNTKDFYFVNWNKFVIYLFKIQYKSEMWQEVGWVEARQH